MSRQLVGVLKFQDKMSPPYWEFMKLHRDWMDTETMFNRHRAFVDICVELGEDGWRYLGRGPDEELMFGKVD